MQLNYIPAQLDTFKTLIHTGAQAVESGDVMRGQVLYDRAVTTCPEAWFGIASKELADGQLQPAYNKFWQVVRAARNARTKAAALNSIGMILTRWGRRNEAMDLFMESHALAKDAANLTNIGTMHQWRQNHAEAVKWFNKAMSADPMCHEAGFARGLSRLMLGDWLEAWQDYEVRWRKKSSRCIKPTVNMPEWRGQKIAGKELMIYLEQGAGDTIQMMRYIPLLHDMGARVAMVCGQGLRRLMESQRLADRLVKDFATDPADYCIGTMSLPRVFQTTPQTVPPAHYIHGVNPRELSGRFKVGVCWAGSADHAHDQFRTIPLEQFARVFQEDATFYSLQKGPRELDLMLGDYPATQLEFNDYQDTAEFVAAMDVIVSVDTSVVHMAGSMGKPVIMLTPFAPDWRWGPTADVSPWYPTVKLVRQLKEGDWIETVERASLTLRSMCGA